MKQWVEICHAQKRTGRKNGAGKRLLVIPKLEHFSEDKVKMNDLYIVSVRFPLCNYDTAIGVLIMSLILIIIEKILIEGINVKNHLFISKVIISSLVISRISVSLFPITTCSLIK